MEYITEPTERQERHHIDGLAADRSHWSDEAGRAFTSVLRELDQWCREQGCSMVNNSWIAEEAIRQSW